MSAPEVAIVGGGPAGMILGYLLAKQGVQTVVLEKNPDFAREFRGEVLQPRFWHAVTQAGIADVFRAIPQEHFSDLKIFFKRKQRAAIDFAEIDKTFPYATWMTQPNMLNGILKEAEKLPHFSMQFGAALKSLTRDESGRVTGLVYRSGDRDQTLATKLVVGADGRFSKLRSLTGFKTVHDTHKFDVMWFEVERPQSYQDGADVFISKELTVLTLPKHPNLIQCGILISPGEAKKYRKAGPEKLAAAIKKLHPMFESFADRLIDFRSFTVLAAKIDLLDPWSEDGLLLIGDAAHTCSPVGAIGVTIATETAIVAAPIIVRALTDGQVIADELAEVRRKRIDEISGIQSFQERGANILLAIPRAASVVAPLVTFAVRTRILQTFARRVLSRQSPLPL